ncbi:MAG: molybdopterin-dependent oxidoreductase [Anaerolineaceae bacterium]|nr:molybdopterin-dependent oxidoreductase [Anaerolineaceae bacterium]
MVSLTIDGKTIQVPEGTTVLRAAEQVQVHIPTLCDHPELTPYGGCRLCLVEVEGIRTLQPSCTLPVSNNMVVRTDTERVKAARKFVLTLIFSERNHFCPFCQVSGGDCELQNAAYAEGMTYWPLQPNWQNYEVDASHPYLIIDHNRCILCRRCVRACSDLVGNHTLGFEERGANSMLIADFGVPLGESSCISCGMCLQVCPTGAIIDRATAYHGKETQVEHHQTVCLGCSVGCGIDVQTRDNQIVRIEGDWMAVANGGVICEDGRFTPMVDERERIHTPLVRRNGKLTAATWDQALEAAVNALKPLVGRTTDGVAAAISTRLSAEELYRFKKLFSEGFKADLVTSLEEGSATASYSKIRKELGAEFEGKLSALDTADCVVAVDFDLTRSHEVVGFFIKRRIPTDTKLVIVDTEPNTMENLASAVLKAKGETYVEMLQGLTAAIVKLGLNKTPSNLSTDGMLENAVQKTGNSAEDYLEAARIIANAQQQVFVYGKKLSGKSGEALAALIELAKTAGALTEDYSGLLSPKGKANSLAAAHYDLEKPFAVNGHQVAYIVLGEDEPSQKLIQSLSKSPFLIVQASYSSQLTANADVVLPTTIWSEDEGHFLSFDGVLQKTEKIVKPAEGIRSHHAVLGDISARLTLELDEKGWELN